MDELNFIGSILLGAYVKAGLQLDSQKKIFCAKVVVNTKARFRFWNRAF